MRFRKLYAPLNDRACEKRTGMMEKIAFNHSNPSAAHFAFQSSSAFRLTESACGRAEPRSACYVFGLVAAIAGRVKKIVAIKLQKIPMAHAIPRPVSAGFRARASDPKPLTAVKSCEQNGFHHARNIMLNLARLLPHEHDVYSVVHADCQHKTEREHIEEIQIDVQQLHRSDHRSNPERQCDDLNQSTNENRDTKGPATRCRRLPLAR